jgi:hypothetical protein
VCGSVEMPALQHRLLDRYGVEPGALAVIRPVVDSRRGAGERPEALAGRRAWHTGAIPPGKPQTDQQVWLPDLALNNHRSGIAGVPTVTAAKVLDSQPPGRDILIRQVTLMS